MLMRLLCSGWPYDACCAKEEWTLPGVFDGFDDDDDDDEFDDDPIDDDDDLEDDDWEDDDDDWDDDEDEEIEGYYNVGE